MRPRQRALELRVADGEHLVDDEDVGVDMRGDREREPRYIPDEYRLRGVSRKRSTPANSTMSSNRRLTSRRDMPSTTPFR